MTKKQLKSIPGVGKASMAELTAYRDRFLAR
jgi:DNA uptake protein ComE-like DNA-binding protein